MPLINTATKVYKGASLATKVYRGTVQVWPPAPAWGPNQSAYTTQTPTAANGPYTQCFGNDFLLGAAGRITGLRYYRPATGAASRTMRVWSSGGVLLGTCATSGDTGTGWMVASFGTPVAITANQVVRVALEGANTGLVATSPAGVDLVNGDVRMINQAYFGAAGTYPITTTATRYWVDVIFQKAL